MCGICGLLSLDGAAPDARALRDMSETLMHRGPDSSGELLDGPVGLAARRLSIIDLAHGDQPIANETGRINVVQNGEIYNYRELRRDLVAKGHRFATECDTEVLVHLYEDTGPGFASELRGMFAIAIWDADRRRLVLARDRFGIKPLYYAAGDSTFAFGSELRALRVLPWLSSELDLDAVEAFLAFNSIPAPLSILRGARKLPPGHVLVLDGGGDPVLERYARPGPVAASAVRRESDGALAEQLRDRLADSVRAHLVADVPVGVLLSGGIDSSALTALAAREGGRVATFSVGFEERSFNELGRARTVAERYGTDHHELVLRPDGAELLPLLARAFDEPLGDSSALPTYLVSELASRHVKAVLSGEGGDELFGGYYTYVADRLADRLAPLAAPVRPLVEALPSSSRKVSLDYKLKRFVRAAHLPPLERHHGWKEIFSEDARAELLDGRRGADPLSVYRARYAETEGAEPLARLQDVDIGIYLVDDLLVKTDRASMTHSLEARVPFLDTAVADFALSLPTAAKVRGLSKKRLLRRAVSGLLPRSIVYGKKQGFSVPAAAWLRGPLEPFAREVLSPERLRSAGYLQPAGVGRLIDEHTSGRQDWSRQLWGLLSLSLWLDGVAPRSPRRASA
jgi:asparagine synthase (glutamine-hydrolysing)